jgi:predicted Fe-Mo cluster-binding NifX family protein
MLAVPLLEDDVAPRFCSADQFMLAELDRGQVCGVHRLTLPDEEWFARLERLAAAGVNVLLCSGFNRRFLPRAEGLGIQVICGLAGKAECLIDAFARDDLEQHRFVPCGVGQRFGHARPRHRHERTR